MDIFRRRLPAVAPTATVAATLLIAAIGAALVFHNRSAGAKPVSADHAIQPTLQGDVIKPVTLPTPVDTHKVNRPDPTRTAPFVLGRQRPPSREDGDPAAQKAAAAFDSSSRPSVELPAAISRIRIPVGAVTAEKSAPGNPSENSVWGGPSPLKPKLSIVAGGTHSCLVSPDGKAVCWGNNDHGQLGVSGERATAPVTVGVEQPFVGITAGANHTCAIVRDGAAWCWGNDDRGQAGDRSLRPRLSPSRVADAHVFWAIAAGDAHTCALDAYGVSWCWGSNAHGQLGEPSIAQSAVPIMAGGGSIRFVSITAGSSFSCALTSAGRASCWGENGGGQLGDGSNFDRSSPVAVASGVFTMISAGSNHTCGVTADGDAYCWGRNTFGQLGDGGTVDRNTPVRVRGGARFTSITAGSNHTCAVAIDGTAYCWGQNTYGQLGTGGAADAALPATVVDGHVFTSVDAFGAHTCGLTISGEAFCWGRNSESQLGDGTQTHRSRPVAVANVRNR